MQRYRQHQECCRRQRGLWSYLLINHIEPVRPVQGMLKLTWFHLVFTISDLHYLALFSFSNPPSLFLPQHFPRFPFFSIFSAFFITLDYPLPSLFLSSNPPLLFFSLRSLSLQSSTSTCPFFPPLSHVQTDIRYTPAQPALIHLYREQQFLVSGFALPPPSSSFFYSPAPDTLPFLLPSPAAFSSSPLSISLLSYLTFKTYKECLVCPVCIHLQPECQSVLEAVSTEAQIQQ